MQHACKHDYCSVIMVMICCPQINYTKHNFHANVNSLLIDLGSLACKNGNKNWITRFWIKHKSCSQCKSAWPKYKIYQNKEIFPILFPTYLKENTGRRNLLKYIRSCGEVSLSVFAFFQYNFGKVFRWNSCYKQLVKAHKQHLEKIQYLQVKMSLTVHD